MAQFDVYNNPSKATRKTYPYILDLQSDIISEISTRIVAPLAHCSHMSGEELKNLTPKISYDGKELLILIPQLASMNAKSLKNPVGSLAHLRDEIVFALDFAITGI